MNMQQSVCALVFPLVGEGSWVTCGHIYCTIHFQLGASDDLNNLDGIAAMPLLMTHVQRKQLGQHNSLYCHRVGQPVQSRFDHPAERVDSLNAADLKGLRAGAAQTSIFFPCYKRAGARR